MKKLFIKLLRDIRKAKGQFIAISLIVLTGVFFRTGASMMAESLAVGVDSYYNEYNLTDLYLHFSHVTAQELSELNSVDGVKKVEGRCTFQANQILADKKTNITLHSIPRDNTINRITVIEGRVPSAKDEIIIDSRYAKENGFAVGDQYEIVYNAQNYIFTISGLCENVEHVFNASESTLVMPDHSQYGIAYMTEEKIADFNGDGAFNEALVDVEGDITKVGSAIEEKASNLTYLYQIPREKMNSYVQVYNNIMVNQMMAAFLPIVLFIVAAVVLMLSITKIIETDRQQIGVMKALGVNNHLIRGYYILYAVLTSGVGTLFGGILGYYLYKMIVISQIEMIYSFPSFEITMDWSGTILYALLAVLLCVFATYLSGRKIFKETAAQAMRPRQPKKVKKVFMEKYEGFWQKLSCDKRIVIRNIFQSKLRTICTIVGIMACVILLIVAFGFDYSLKEMANHLLNNIYKYDLKIELNDTKKIDEIVLPDEIDAYSEYLEMPIQFNVTEIKDANLAVIDASSKMICFYDENNRQIQLTDNGIIIPKAYAEAYHLHAGDTLKFRFIQSQYNGQTIEAKIINISTQYNNQAIYCTPAFLKQNGVTAEPKIILASVKENTDISKIYGALANDTGVLNITLRSDMEKSKDESLEQNSVTVILFILCAMLMASVAIYLVSSINIFERRRDVATMKVLGCGKKKLNRLVFTENIFITVFAIIIALPLGVVFYQSFFAKMLSTIDCVIPPMLNAGAIILTVIITLAVTVTTNFMLGKKVKKINMVESLKSIE